MIFFPIKRFSAEPKIKLAPILFSLLGSFPLQNLPVSIMGKVIYILIKRNYAGKCTLGSYIRGRSHVHAEGHLHLLDYLLYLAVYGEELFIGDVVGVKQIYRIKSKIKVKNNNMWFCMQLFRQSSRGQIMGQKLRGGMWSHRKVIASHPEGRHCSQGKVHKHVCVF